MSTIREINLKTPAPNGGQDATPNGTPHPKVPRAVELYDRLSKRKDIAELMRRLAK
jgi:hypothetical protein